MQRFFTSLLIVLISIQLVFAISNVPVDFSVEQISHSIAHLSWTDNSNDEVGFMIERRNESMTEFINIANVSANVEFYNERGRELDNTYIYRIRAYNFDNENLVTSDYTNDISLTLSEIHTVTEKTWPTNIGDSEITLWYDDKTAAATITIDDNWAPNHGWWMNKSDYYDFRFTWFVITGRVSEDPDSTAFWGTWNDFQQLHEQGHDIQSHTIDHLGSEFSTFYEYSQSIVDIESHISGSKVLTMAYPGGVNSYKNDEELASKLFIGSRGTSGNLNSPWPNYNMMRVGFSMNPEVTWAYIPSLIDPTSRYYRYSAVKLHHEVDATDDSAELEYMNFLKDNEDEFWIPTFTELLLFSQERDSASVSTLSISEDEIRLSLTDKMEDDIFDFPITIKLRVSNDWNSVSAIQNSANIDSKIITNDSNKYVLINAVPDKGEIVVTGSTDGSNNDNNNGAGVYIGGSETNTMFDSISDECINSIKEKKYLFHSRSYGQNLLNGIWRLSSIDSKYDISKTSYDLRDGSSVPAIPSVAPSDAFDSTSIVHNLCELPREDSVPEFDATIRDHYFDDINFAMLESGDFAGINSAELYSLYTDMMDQLVIDYPTIDFVYYTYYLGCGPTYGNVDDTNEAVIYNNLLFDSHLDSHNIFDMYDVISTREFSPSTSERCIKTNGVWNYADCECFFDGTSLRTCCVEYNNPVNDHPRTEIGETRFGKALYVLMSELYCSDNTQCSVDLDCDDGLFCNGVESCSSGTCVSGTSPCASDSFSCTLDCDETNDVCSYEPQNHLCNDANSCTDDVCSSSNGCVYTSNDVNSCSLTGECAENFRCESGFCIADKNPLLCSNPTSCSDVSCSDQYSCVYSDCPIASSLKLWLTFEDDTLDYSNNGNDAINYGATPIEDKDGNLDGAYYFDGQDYMDLGTGSFDIEETNEFTIAFWINPSGVSTTTTLLAKGQYNTPFWIQINSDNRFRYGLRTTSTYYLISNDAIENDQWSHVVFTYESSSRAIYINGVQSGFDNTEGVLSFGLQEVNLGKNVDSDDYFIGSIDELRIYNEVLTQSEIINLYNGTNVDNSNNHDADLDDSGTIELLELNNYIQSWRSSVAISLANLIEAIKLWKSG